MGKVLTSMLTFCLVWSLYSAPLYAATAEWTVLVFMNAKNNLEEDGIGNFLQMADVGSNEKVNIVVEMGRPTKHITEEYGKWSGVLRFRVTRGMKPTVDYAESRSPRADDMGSAETLAKFVREATAKYPAKRYMLVIWDHGQGWRLKYANTFEERRAGARNATVPAEVLRETPVRSGFRSISRDDDTGHLLYNRDIQETLSKLPKELHPHVIGFDACLMAMIETAYAMKNIAAIMVGSEELEPGAGWNYRIWLTRLLANPMADPQTLAKIVVDAYQEQYGDDQRTTLSSVDLGKIEPLASAVSSFAIEAKSGFNGYQGALVKARQSCSNYGATVGIKNPIDLSCFLKGVEDSSAASALREKARTARELVDQAVLANYASRRVQTGYGSKGISIYFPANMADHRADPDHEGYDVGNAFKPVEFVEKEGWAPFLQRYLSGVGN